jgi:lysophospholipase L1-like esterase
VDAYNSVALELAAERNIPVDDLHAVIDDAGRTRLLKEDGVHFVDEGSRLLGEAVAAFVRPFLSG